MKRKIPAYLLFSVLFLPVYFFSCYKEIPSSIPDRDVYVETDYSEFSKLKIINNAVEYIPPPLKSGYRYGFGGIVIYRGLDEKLRCYDLACPVEVLPTVRVEIKPPFATCPKCGSQYDLNAIGSPTAGPAKESLRNYSNIRETSSEIIVYH
jgi:hypothetical protein